MVAERPALPAVRQPRRVNALRLHDGAVRDVEGMVAHVPMREPDGFRELDVDAVVEDSARALHRVERLESRGDEGCGGSLDGDLELSRNVLPGSVIAGPFPRIVGDAPSARLPAPRLIDPPARAQRGAGPGTAGAGTRRGRACRRPELAQDVERQLALHARPHLPAGHLSLGTHRARRRHPRLDALDHVHGRRPPKPRHQGVRQRVGVADPPGRGPVGQIGARGVGERQGQGLLALVVDVVTPATVIVFDDSPVWNVSVPRVAV